MRGRRVASNQTAVGVLTVMATVFAALATLWPGPARADAPAPPSGCDGSVPIPTSEPCPTTTTAPAPTSTTSTATPAPSSTTTSSTAGPTTTTPAAGRPGSTQPVVWDGPAGAPPAGSSSAPGPTGGAAPSSQPGTGGSSSGTATDGNPGLSQFLSLPPDQTGAISLSVDGPMLGDTTFTVADGPRSTLAVLRALRGLNLNTALLAQVLAPFPVAGPASYPASPATIQPSVVTPGTTTSAPPAPPPPPAAPGVDIVSVAGTPVIASGAGTVHFVPGDTAGSGGLVLTAADGTTFHYQRLDKFVAGLVDGQSVVGGTVLGSVPPADDPLVAPHLSFQVEPPGQGPTDPMPYLDRWLADALHTAQNMAARTHPMNRSGPTVSASGRRNALLNAADARSTPTDNFTTTLFGLVVIATVAWQVRRRRSTRTPVPDIPLP
ncbi:MAG: Peptidase [Acidimicrobiales bacterium]|nr:Peptidase [Acidimicrobiales bacterium]